MPFLWEMLYLSLHVRRGQILFPRTVLESPDIAHYSTGFGRRDGDDAQLCIDSQGARIGASWVRLLTSEDPGYGYVSDDIPRSRHGCRASMERPRCRPPTTKTTEPRVSIDLSDSLLSDRSTVPQQCVVRSRLNERSPSSAEVPARIPRTVPFYPPVKPSEFHEVPAEPESRPPFPSLAEALSPQPSRNGALSFRDRSIVAPCARQMRMETHQPKEL